MRIAINCRSAMKVNSTGIGRYSFNLLNSLGQLDTQNRYFLYASKSVFDCKRRLPPFPFKNFKPVWDIFNQGPKHLLKAIDVYHLPCPALVEPLPGAKLIVTVHDLVYKAYPESHTAETIEASASQMESVVRSADKIICVSESAHQDLHRFFKIDKRKTTVIHNGVDHDIFFQLPPLERSMASERLHAMGIDGKFILFVGTIEPRKNLKGLLESFAVLKKKKLFEGKLVVVGMKGWMMQDVLPLVKKLGLSHDVFFAGFVSDEQLRDLYNLTELFVFPSFYEGFGFPILEAFCCGAPVVVSNSSACREIAGKGGHAVDPYDYQAIALGMDKVLNDPALNERLRTDGLKRAQEFSFAQTAKMTLEVYAG